MCKYSARESVLEGLESIDREDWSEFVFAGKVSREVFVKFGTVRFVVFLINGFSSSRVTDAFPCESNNY